MYCWSNQGPDLISSKDAILVSYLVNTKQIAKKKVPGAVPGGGAHPARAPPKIGKNKIFWRKIVIFHTKYPKYFRASLRSAQFFYVHPPSP